MKLKCRDKDIWKKIEEAQKDPEYIRAAYEFIRLTTGHSSPQ